MQTDLIGRRVSVRNRGLTEWVHEFYGIVRGADPSGAYVTFLLEVVGTTGKTSYLEAHQDITSGGLISITTHEHLGVFLEPDDANTSSHEEFSWLIRADWRDVNRSDRRDVDGLIDLRPCGCCIRVNLVDKAGHSDVGGTLSVTVPQAHDLIRGLTAAISHIRVVRK